MTAAAGTVKPVPVTLGEAWVSGAPNNAVNPH